MRPALVSIAAGRSQLALLEAARARGLAVIAVDRDPDAAGFALADAVVHASTHDPRAVLRGLEPLRERFELRAVATKSSGVPVETTAVVARALSLPGLDPAGARATVTKPGTMELAERAGVPVPGHHVCDDARALEALELAFPLVVKPALTRVGKAAVAVARDADELRTRFADARAASGDGRVEVEELVPGRDVVLATLFADSVLEPIVLVDEDTRFDDAGVARGIGLRLPSRASGSELEARLVADAARFVGESRLGSGVGFFTFRVGDSGHALIETHFDLAGDWLADRLFGGAGPFSLIDATIDVLSGEGLPRAPRRFAATRLRFVHARDLAEVDALCRAPGVLQVEVDRAAARAASDPWTRVGFVLSRAPGAAARRPGPRRN